MKILSIDSTSSTSRISLTDGNQVIQELVSPIDVSDWDKMIGGDIDFLIKAQLNLINRLTGNDNRFWDIVDYICYSGFSGFKSSITVGKIIAETLGSIYNKEVIAIDHITAHYFSLFVNRGDTKEIFPKFIYSASGSHNSLVYMKDKKTLSILNDDTYFDYDENKYIGLGSIYNRLLRYLDILKIEDTPQDIPKILEKIKPKVNDKLVSKFKSLYTGKKIFDLDLFQLYTDCKRVMKEKKSVYSNSVMFFSFQQCIFEIISEKFDKILEIMDVNEIAIVGGISHNDNFIEYLIEKNKAKNITIIRPEKQYRFDNASMLGVLAYYMKKNDIEYPFSKIITE